MSARRYRLLCPIARALDVVGDRWTLLILRDLHAGPARYHELQEGLGIATNLLSTRLTDLADAGMIERSADGYRLTDAGRSTDRLLWELTRFGSGLERDPDPKEPGNLRTLVLPLRILLEAAADRPELRARIEIDTAEVTIVSSPREATVEWGRTTDPVDIVARTNYEAFLDLSEGVVSLPDFAHHHLEIVAGTEYGPQLLALFEAALRQADDPRTGVG